MQQKIKHQTRQVLTEMDMKYVALDFLDWANALSILNGNYTSADRAADAQAQARAEHGMWLNVTRSNNTLAP